MQIGAFEMVEPLPELRVPHLFVSLRPWIDVGSVGTLTFGTLERKFGAQDLGQLSRPGAFYDFTRYRPTISWVRGARRIDVPNSILRWARGPGEHDLIFLHALEPQSLGEDFVESVVEVAKKLGIRRYCQIGSMYGPAPHTRPFKAAGSATEEAVQDHFKQIGIRGSSYEGPTSIMALATERVRTEEMETLSLMIQLPSYTQLDENYKGQETMLRLLMGLYKFDIAMDSIVREAEQQYRELERAIQADPRVLAVVRQLENMYDEESAKPDGSAGDVHLSPEVESFLRDIERG